MADPDLMKLAEELSASAGTKIPAPDGTPLTLRQAVAGMHGKLRGQLRLADRPRDPKLKDDLYGHVLSMRAEGLITQALLAEVVTKILNPNYQMRDVKAVRDAVIRSFQ